jgi:putative spermidine/putrescine transport system substrate-binding protein
MLRKLAFAAALLVTASWPAQAADQMVFTAWGGTTQEAQKTAFADSYSKQSGVEVLQDGPTDYGKLKAMVDSGNVTWDVVDVEMDFAIVAAKQGLIEPIDYAVVDKGKLDPRFASDHFVGSFFFSFVLGYNKDVFKEAPQSWADLFDEKKFPGKRTFYKWSAPGALEIALLADGVAPDKLYPLDLDRAFKKLDAIKANIQWWGSGAESQQFLASGEAPIGMFWNPRIFAVQKEGGNVDAVWNQNLTAADVLVVPKGSKKKDLAMKFLANATGAEAQAQLSGLTQLSPINLDSKAKLDPAAIPGLPESHTEGQINLNMDYWAEHRDEIAKRWYDWQAK